MKHPERLNTPSPSPPIKRRRSKNKIMHYNHERRPVLAPPRYFSEEYQRRQQLKKKHKQHYRQQQKNKNLSRSHRHYMPRDGSLSTIPEESGSYRSASTASIGSHMETNPRNVQVSTIHF